ncbi:tetratricopeptide repeat protein [Candidatus Woesearchaeota archaeon]|nr:tetratricopeptide repeat protein [Candidatus Woesearchaeota archaeon]
MKCRLCGAKKVNSDEMNTCRDCGFTMCSICMAKAGEIKQCPGCKKDMDSAYIKARQEKTLKELQSKAEKNPDNPKVLYDLGIVLYNIKNDEQKAIDLLKRSSELKKGYAAPLLSLVMLYQRKGDLKRAEEACKNILEADPKNHLAYYNLGIIYTQQRRLMDAAKSYAEALKINPKMPQAYNNLGNILVMGGKTKQAISAYENAVMLGHPRKDKLEKQIENLRKAHDGN